MVIKRDGRIVEFDKEKIESAILKAFYAVDGKINPYAQQKAENIATFIESKSNLPLTVEEIQDYVENGLMATQRKDVAKAYILYRSDRTKRRGNTTDDTLNNYLSGVDEYWNKENSNKDAEVVTTQRDYIAGIVSTDYAKRFLLPKEVVEAHEDGLIHQHDMDYMMQKALNNCCLINLDDMLSNGTVINGVKIDPQKRILTAATVATQIITAVASSQYGGCTISLAHLAPYVKKSYDTYKEEGLSLFDHDIDKSETYAINATKREVKDAVQTFNYQINSMSTTNG